VCDVLSEAISAGSSRKRRWREKELWAGSMFDLRVRFAARVNPQEQQQPQ